MQYKITKKDKILKGEVYLEGSKSITNRVLIIKALCPDFFELKNYSRSEDSTTLFNLINSKERVLNAKDGGTTIRFLAAYLAVCEGEVVLTGSERLIERPIGPLVDALVSLGADIQYLAKRNYPPIYIKGKQLHGNRVEVDSDISSQFVSALLLIAPILKNGLIIKLKGEVVSRPYIEMTLTVMKHFGIRYNYAQNIISIARQEYAARDFNVEADWSAASYYYEMAALADEVDLKLFGLNKISAQGDYVITRIMENFGVSTTFIEGGVHLRKNNIKPGMFEYNFRDCPDLAQTMLASCAGLNLPAKISGISNLQIKETNRIAAMQAELSKLGASFHQTNGSWTLESGNNLHLNGDLVFKTYRDHRMAMSLTPLAFSNKHVVIENPEVVNKSYPSFWKDISRLGFEIEKVS